MLLPKGLGSVVETEALTSQGYAKDQRKTFSPHSRLVTSMSHRVSSEATHIGSIHQLKEQCHTLLLNLNVRPLLCHSHSRRKARQVEEDPEEDEEAELGDEDEDVAGGQMDVDGEENGDSVCTTIDR